MKDFYVFIRSMYPAFFVFVCIGAFWAFYSFFFSNADFSVDPVVITLPVGSELLQVYGANPSDAVAVYYEKRNNTCTAVFASQASSLVTLNNCQPISAK